MTTDEFTAFCDAEYPRLLGALTLWCRGDRAVAEEVCQDAFARAYRDWHRIRHLDQPSAWVRRIGMNLATSRFRRVLAERRATRRLAGRADADPDHGADHDALTDQSHALAQALQRLSIEQRRVVVLRYYLDLPVDEVARITRRAPSAVTSMTSRALEALRARLGNDWMEARHE